MADLEAGLEADFPERPCLGGCGRLVRAVELYGSVFAQMCPECRAASDAEEEASERAKRVEQLLDRVKMGGRVKEWSRATYPQDARGKRALREGLAWLDGYRAGSRAGLLVFGPIGTGKTGLAWALVRELIEADLVEANMVIFRDWLAEVREAFGSHRERGKHPLASVPVLFLDDLGAERPTDFARDELATLIERRYQRQLPTCATSNYTPAELAERLGHDDPIVGGRIVSRLQDGAVQLRIEGRDRRL